MPLTLSAKFKVLQNQNYYGYHITGGKLFCTSVLNSNFSLTRIVVGAKFLANGYIKCNFMCSDYELLDMESDMFNYCILSNIHWNVPVWHGSAWKVALPLACPGKRIILPEQNLSDAISRTVSSKKQNFTSVYL